jgi:molybdopterin converting factor small subunit
MEYSTGRNHLILPEYGRNIQKMVEHIITIEDREERNRAAQEIINIMGRMNPHLRDINDFKHKLWDQLMLMSDFKLDIDSPYPVPTKETFEEKPHPIEYTTGKLKYRYLGRIMEKLVRAATELENEEEKAELVKIITNHMKKSYLLWNRDVVEDKVIFDTLTEISNGKLAVEKDAKLSEAKDLIGMRRKKKKDKRK